MCYSAFLRVQRRSEANQTEPRHGRSADILCSVTRWRGLVMAESEHAAEPLPAVAEGVTEEGSASVESQPQEAQPQVISKEEEKAEETDAVVGEGGEGEESAPLTEDREEVEAVPEEKKADAFEQLARLEHLNVVFIGHVDAGKSTICGQILYSTGQVDDRTIEKYEREAKEKNRQSWFLAYIMDTNEEERAKGKTVECGRAVFATQKKRYTILDAPGHKNYVPNMIMGAAQADVGILVISARKGEFETGFEKGGQTREHAMLAKTLGVRQLVILVNKMDDSNWSEERFNEIQKKIEPFLKSLGFNIKNHVNFLPGSGISGEGITKPIPDGVATWNKYVINLKKNIFSTSSFPVLIFYLF